MMTFYLIEFMFIDLPTLYLTGDVFVGSHEIDVSALSSGQHLFILNVEDGYGKSLMKVHQFTIGTGKLVMLVCVADIQTCVIYIQTSVIQTHRRNMCYVHTNILVHIQTCLVYSMQRDVIVQTDILYKHTDITIDQHVFFSLQLTGSVVLRSTQHNPLLPGPVLNQHTAY